MKGVMEGKKVLRRKEVINIFLLHDVYDACHGADGLVVVGAVHKDDVAQVGTETKPAQVYNLLFGQDGRARRKNVHQCWWAVMCYYVPVVLLCSCCTFIVLLIYTVLQSIGLSELK